MSSKSQWVSPRDGGKWAVHGAGNSKDTKLFDTQKAATAHAVSIAKNNKSEVVVQGRNGRIVSKDSFGNDPNPPHDKEH